MRRKLAVDKTRLSPLGKRLVEGMEEVLAHIRGKKRLRVRRITIPNPINVRAIRRKTGLSQTEFAARYGFNVRTLQEWEQGRVRPETAARAYLTVIKRNSAAVEEALKKSA